MEQGQGKWFNAKAGYGFVTTLGGENKGREVFVHHSGLNVKSEQFRYLVEGEYVEMKVSESKGNEKWQGGEVTGIGGGRLMCETRAASSEGQKVRERVEHGGRQREHGGRVDGKRERVVNRVKVELSE